MPDAPYIQYRGVSVRLGEVAALRDVSLEIGQGEFVFLVGPTGAGKSTLLKLLTREVRHTDGEVRLDGQEVGDFREGNLHRLRRQMGIVPQDFGLLPNKRVWENLAYALRATGRSRREVRQEVPRILEEVNLAHRLDAFPHQISGGEQQRAAIARALINRPPLLVADEPTGHLDPVQSAYVMELLQRLNENGTTVLVASHGMAVVERFGQRVVTLELGRIVSDRRRPLA